MSSKPEITKPASRGTRITAAQFDAKFVAGEDITEHLDPSTARVFPPDEGLFRQPNPAAPEPGGFKER